MGEDTALWEELKRSFEGRRVMVVGGTGFLGGWVTVSLCLLGASVVVVGREPSKLPRAPGISGKKIDILSGRLPSPSSFDYVFWCVLPARGRVLNARPELATKALDAFVRLLKNSRGERTRFIVCSTASVHGTKAGRVTEDSPVSPLSANAVYHMGLEHFARVLLLGQAKNLLVLRYFSLYGPRQSNEQLVQMLLQSAARKRPVRIRGRPSDLRDFVYVGDAAICTLGLAARRDAYGRTVNVCTGEPRSLAELVGTVEEVSGWALKVRFLPRKTGDIVSLYGDNGLLRKFYRREFTSLAQGIALTLSWRRGQ